jgi:hypothetical protein
MKQCNSLGPELTNISSNMYENFLLSESKFMVRGYDGKVSSL